MISNLIWSVPTKSDVTWSYKKQALNIPTILAKCDVVNRGE